MLVEYQLIIRNAADTADALEVTSVRGGTNPYISSPPVGDGASIDRITGKVTSGSFTGRIADPITAGTSRLFTSLLEDATGRLQLGHRKAFWKFREDGGAWQTLIAGRLTRYPLVSDIEWAITVSDLTEAEHQREAFDPVDGETIADYFARYPNRGCILGGPIIGSFLSMKDFGGWRMEVEQVSAVGERPIYLLKPKNVYGPTTGELSEQSWRPGANILWLADQINEAVRSLPRTQFLGPFVESAFTTVAHTRTPGPGWQGLVALINGEWYRPVWAGYIGPYTGENRFDLVRTEPGRTGVLVMRDSNSQSALANGQIVTLRVLTILPSELSPILLEGHPVDQVTALWTGAGISYSAAAVETMRDALGSSLDLPMAITSSKKLGSFLEDTYYGPFGIGVRSNSMGQLEMFPTRVMVNTLPAVTIDSDDVYVDETRAFDVDTSGAVRKLIIEDELIATGLGPTLLGYTTAERRFERENADPGAIGTGEVTYTIPGMVRFTDASGINYPAWVNARAHELFDQRGRGLVRLRTVFRRGGAGDDAKVGDEFLIDLPAVPRANKRLGDDDTISSRAFMVVHATPTARGVEAELEDSGPNAQPLATKPTHTIAASTDQPRTIAFVTITNAAALTAAGYALRLQVAITTGAVPAAEDYSDALYYAAADIPTTAIALPALFADRAIYVRGRSEKAGSRPSDWSTGVGVALDALDAPTAVTATPNGSDASRATLTWALGADAANAQVEVLLRVDGETIDQAQLIAVLPAGSINFEFTELVATTNYIASVRHYDERTNDRSAATDDAFTTGASLVTLAAPTNPDGFSFAVTIPGIFSGRPIFGHSTRYGIAVVATEHPSDVEIAEAVETGVGTGAYGAYVTKATVPSISGDWTIWRGIMPNDGKRRKLKARHTRRGTTSSAYSSEVVLTPGTTDPLAMFPNTALTVRATEQSKSATQVVVRLAVADPAAGGTGDVTLTYVGVGVGAIAPASPRTLASTGITADLATTATVDITIDRDAYGTGPGRVNFVATRSGRVAGIASIDVPCKDTVALLVRASLQAVTATQATVRVAVADPAGGGSGDVSLVYVNAGVGTVAPASPQTLASAGITTDLGTTATVDITVDRAAPSAGPGRVTFTATRTGRVAGVASIDIPMLDGIPQGTVAIREDGGVEITVDGQAWVGSHKYATSTSAFPSEATVRASGTTVNGRQMSATLAAATLDLGDTIFITVLPYSAAGAAGTEGSSIKLRATRHDFSATKTAYYTASSFRLMSNGGAGALVDANEYVYPSGFAMLDVPYAVGAPIVPNGVTITQVAWHFYENGGLNFLQGKLIRLDDTASWGYVDLTGSDSSTGVGQQIVTSSISESTTGRRYKASVSFVINDAPTQGNMRFNTLSITYTMPTSSAAL